MTYKGFVGKSIVATFILFLAVFAAFAIVSDKREGDSAFALESAEEEGIICADNDEISHAAAYSGAHGSGHSGKKLTKTYGNLSSGKYFLDGDIFLTGRLVIPEGKTVEICLNGYKISTSKMSYSPEKCAFFVDAGATLNLYDCCTGDCAEAGHIHAFGKQGTESYTEIKGGLITADGAITASGGGIFINNGGAVTLYGGSIAGNYAISSGDCGGGVYMFSGGTFDMRGGIVGFNKAAGDGGGVYINNGAFSMSGGRICGNLSERGGGVYVTGSGSSFNLSGGKICDNQSSFYGGVYVKNGKLNICGGEISGNVADSYGGAYLGVSPIKIGGNTRISDNFCCADGDVCDSNLYVGKGKRIQADDLSDAALIGVTTASDEVFAEGVSEGASHCFFSDCGYLCAEYNEGEITFHAEHGGLGEWTIENEGDELAKRTQSRTCSVCNGAKVQRELELCGLEVSYEKSVSAFEKVQISSVTALFSAEGEVCDRLQVSGCKVQYPGGDCCRVGDESVKISYTAGGTTVEKQLDVDVSPIELPISGEDKVYVYDGNFVTFCVTGGGEFVNVSGNVQRDAGKYTVSVAAKPEYADDVIIDGAIGGVLLLEFQIEPRRVAAEITSPTQCIYGESWDFSARFVQDEENGIFLPVEGDIDCGGLYISPVYRDGIKPDDVGEYSVGICLAGERAKNYLLAFVAEAAVTVSPRTLPVVAHYSLPEHLYAGGVLPTVSCDFGEYGEISWDDDFLTVGTHVYGWTFTPFDILRYDKVKGNAAFTAEEAAPVALNIISEPDKAEYFAFEDFDKKGLRLELVYADGTSRILCDDDYIIAGGENMCAGDREIVFTCCGLSASYRINVQKIAVLPPQICAKKETGGLLFADIEESVLYTVGQNAGGTQAGVYKVVLKLSDAANYQWVGEEGESVTLTFTILRACAEYSDGSGVAEVVLESESGFDPFLKLDVLDETTRFSSRYGYAEGESGVCAVYAVRMLAGSKSVALADKVTLKFHIPEELSGKSFSVMRRCAPTDIAESVAFTIDGGYVIISEDDFVLSEFFFVENGAEGEGDGARICMIVLSSLAASACVCALVTSAIRKHRGGHGKHGGEGN